MSAPARASFILESAGGAYASSGDLMSPRGSICTSCSRTSTTRGATTGVSCRITCLFRRSSEVSRPRGIENGPGGGCTGAKGRGGIFARGTIGGGGLDVAGCPSASRKRRMRSASVSLGARLVGSLICGVTVDPGSVFCAPFFDSPALLASNLNSAAMAMSRMKRRLSRCMLSIAKSLKSTSLRRFSSIFVTSDESRSFASRFVSAGD